MRHAILVGVLLCSYAGTASAESLFLGSQSTLTADDGVGPAATDTITSWSGSQSIADGAADAAGVYTFVDDNGSHGALLRSTAVFHFHGDTTATGYFDFRGGAGNHLNLSGAYDARGDAPYRDISGDLVFLSLTLENLTTGGAPVLVLRAPHPSRLTNGTDFFANPGVLLANADYRLHYDIESIGPHTMVEFAVNVVPVPPAAFGATALLGLCAAGLYVRRRRLA